jgi:hypothetical protein
VDGHHARDAPPADRLKEEEIAPLLKALKELLNECNWSFVLQTEVPEVVQYECLRQNWDQEAKVKQWHDGFFVVCKAGTPIKTCALGEYCQCAFFQELFKDMVDEDLTPEEERARALEIEVQHIQRKYGEDWMKYYPYHLDKDYDDEYGNPYDYGMGADDEDDDDWWRR